MKKFLTASELGKLENVSAMTAIRWTQKGYFPNARKVGRTYRIPLSDYHKWRESTKLNSTKLNNEKE
jgi:excisionase family DNA binding protein